jgi:hypothetical protein
VVPRPCTSLSNSLPLSWSRIVRNLRMLPPTAQTQFG